MSTPHGKPIERHPRDTTLPRGWHALWNGGRPYRPRDKPVQEDWESVARKFGIGVKELIYFNFMTVDPDGVNWYLHHHTGCNKVSPSGNNWMFSNSANPGIIYIPPPDDEHIDFKPEQVCQWIPSSAKVFIMRLVAVSQVISGQPGIRIRKLVGVIARAGYPACLNLWYYNDMNVVEYADVKTKNSQLREMTKATLGAFPFDGDSGLHRQSGTQEQYSGKWRIHAVRDLFDEFACRWDAAAVKSRLENIDDLMYRGWHALSAVGDRTAGGGGGNAYDSLVYDFINHVRFLSKDDTHLYSAFGS